ncbi:hypothetical protein BY458DRAFT_499121 [Sporodiniella umbellata]|nr:hypothetical protein BY458DRAFT_499121 [Sporodiniella umbellata]
MSQNWNTKLPETPSPNYVVVKNISLDSQETTVKEFFLFCGKITEFELKKDEEDEKHQIALIHFERESAANTAVLLSNALVDDSHITASPYFDIPSEGKDRSAEGQASETEAQETKAKSRIAAEILASGYMLQDHVVAKGLEYDNKYNLSSRLTGFLGNLQSNAKQFDDKYRIWDNVMNINQKYKITEKAQTAAQTAQEKAQAALQTPTGQKVHDFANQTLAQIAAVHYEAKKIHGEKLNAAHPQAAAPASTQ